MVPKLGRTFQNIKNVLKNAYEIEDLTSGFRTLQINGKYLKLYQPNLQEIHIGTRE